MAEYDEKLKYLSQKRPLLSAQGTKLDELYYNKINSVVEYVECTYTQGRLTQSLTSFMFNSSSTIVIPMGSFIGQTYLHLRLPNLVANQTLPRGWGIMCIRAISYLFGSSNVSQITINKQTLMHLLLAQSETSDKASEWFRLAGSELRAPVPVGDLVCADILLPLPWSNMSGLWPKKEFDTTLLSTSITINIEFEPASAFYGGSGTRPSGFLDASISYRTGDMANKSLGLKDVLQRNPSEMYSYPYLFPQSYVSQTFTGSTTSLVNVQLQSFINADLVGMILCVVKNTDITTSSNNTPSAFNYDPIRNLTVALNGQTIYYAPHEQYKLINMQGSLGASYFHNSIIAAGDASPFNSTPVDSYCQYVWFSRVPAATFNNHMQNVWRIGNNTVSISLNTSTTGLYTMYASFIYNAVAEIGNGETRIYTD